VAIQRNSSTLEGKDSASAYIGTCVGGQGLRPNANDERHLPQTRRDRSGQVHPYVSPNERLRSTKIRFIDFLRLA